jgi:hypothetical protein
MTYFERHDAIVSNIDDPEKLGRIKVMCETLLGVVELPYWIPPRFHFVQAGGGYFGVPAKDTWVELLVPVGSDVDEVWDEQSLQMEGSGLRWECTTYNDIQKLHEYFKTNYPQRHGYAWPNGWLWLVDSKDGEMIWAYVPDEKQDPEAWVKIQKDHTIEIGNSDGAVILLKPDKKIVIEGDNVFVGDAGATEHIPLGDALFTFLNTVATGWGATHTHLAGALISGAPGAPVTGTTGTPVVPMDVPVQVDLVSGKHTVEK